MRKVLIAIDKFKGSLSACEAAGAIAAGLSRKAQVEVCPLADGGEGSIDAVRSAVGGIDVCVDTHDPLMRPLKASYLFYDTGQHSSALIESARVCGLQLLSLAECNPLLTTTYPLGEMILDAVGRGARHITVALGGSATNDCGTGMLEALGYRFFDASGNRLTMCGRELEHVARIDCSKVDARLKQGVEFCAACDVTNPLVGVGGATRVYAPQKGANDDSMEVLERGMNNFVTVADKTDMADFEGGGAAGGLGAAMRCFLMAQLVSGWKMIADMIGLEHVVEECSLVITGEGKVDSQSFSGKLVDGVSELTRKHGKSCWVFCGECELSQKTLEERGIERVFALSSIEPDRNKCMTDARQLIERLATLSAEYLIDR